MRRGLGAELRRGWRTKKAKAELSHHLSASLLHPGTVPADHLRVEGQSKVPGLVRTQTPDSPLISPPAT